jgi:hypothetical protein
VEGVDNLAEFLHHKRFAIGAGDLRRGMEADQGVEISGRDALGRSELGCVDPFAQFLHGEHIEPLQQAGFTLHQAMELLLQQGRQGLGEGGEENAGVRIVAGEEDGAVQRHDGLARSR